MDKLHISAIFIRMIYISYIMSSQSSKQRWLKFTETDTDLLIAVQPFFQQGC